MKIIFITALRKFSLWYRIPLLFSDKMVILIIMVFFGPNFLVESMNLLKMKIGKKFKRGNSLSYSIGNDFL
jgi:hypothetical protein